jgi:hypothetical protein
MLLFYFSFVGTSADGAMIRSTYPAKLNHLVKTDDDGHEFYSHTWDSAHLNELADKDTKNPKTNKAHAWVSEREKVISDIHKEVGYGKALEELHTQAEALSQFLKRVGLYTPMFFIQLE